MLRTLGITAAVSMVAITTVAAPTQAAYRVHTPRGLHAVSATQTTMRLDWKAAPKAKAYRVQLSAHKNMSNPRYFRFAKSSGVVRSLTPHKRYYFRVTALGAGAKRLSGYTTRTYPSALTRPRPLAGPANLAVVSTTPDAVSLTWKAPKGATTYRVATSTTPDFASLIRTRTTRPSATIGGLVSGQPYYFKVRVTRPNGVVLTQYSDTVAGQTRAAVAMDAPTPVRDGASDVRVGSYNVQSVSLDATSGEQRPWKQRRPGVLANILGENLDVIGLQEANHSTVYSDRLVDGTTQFEDIRNGLNSGGQHFEVTNPYSANCVNASTSYNCTYQDRGVSGSDRIMYNADRISLISQGGYAYPTQDPEGTPRNLAYAVLQVNETGDRFLFVSTHLEAHSAPVRYDQWRELIARVGQLKGSLPVMVVGDFNMQKFDPNAAEWLPAMKDAGMGDVLNQEYNVNPSRNVRAQHLVNGWINSLNHLDRDITSHAYEDRHDKTGNNIDWIFATNSLVVKEWKVVLDYDPATLMIRGVIPSDHNMVRATITIP